MGLRFGMLGPLEVRSGNRPLRLGTPRQRTLLALLLVNAGRPVSMDRIQDEMWRDDAPEEAKRTIHVYISQLRKVLGAESIETLPDSYALLLGSVEYDAPLFERISSQGRDALAAGRADEAAILLREALELWRGPALADVRLSPALDAEAMRLEEARLRAAEDRAEAELACGRHADVVSPLETLVAEHPLRERAWGQLILALYRSGRQADALDRFRRVRVLLAEELGIDPGPELRALEQAILRQDPSLAAPGTTARAATLTAGGDRVRPLTVMLTDLEGSTRLLAEHPEIAADVLVRVDRTIAAGVEAHRGTVPREQGEGDSLVATFEHAGDAVACALAVQRSIVAESWQGGVLPRVRAAVDSGEVLEREGKLVGMTLHRCARVRALAHGGQVLLTRAAVDQAGELPEGATLRDLGPHRLRDLGSELVFQLCHDELPGDFPPLREEVAPSVTSFVGREQELSTLEEALQSARLLTLTGAGGCGKTRLALELASRASARFRDGVFVADLAAVTDVAATVAAALDVREEGATPSEALKAYLCERMVLIVLDNCEHVLDACAELCVDVLKQCPDVVLIATSRQQIGVAGEEVWRVPPLSPHEAVRLFVERARAADITFALTDENSSAVDEICEQLDGMPLAIELAAARVRVLGAEQVRQRLGRRLGLLTRSQPGTLSRHQTLRAAIDWSVESLSDEERLLFARLSVFSGRFTLEGVESVCAFGDLQADEILDFVSELVDTSLVEAEPDGGVVRYRMLQTIRDYAAEDLRRRVQDDELRRRHRDFYVSFVGRTRRLLQSPDQLAWLATYDAETDNFRAALSLSIERSDADEALRLAGGTAIYWRHRGRLAEVRGRLEEALSRGAQAGPVSRAGALTALAGVAHDQGDLAAGAAAADEAISIYRELDDPDGLAEALYAAASVAIPRGEHSGAEATFGEMLEVGERHGNTWAVATALQGQALLAYYRSELPKARGLYERTIETGRQILPPDSVAMVLLNLGNVSVALGDDAKARSLYEESVAIYRRVGAPREISMVLCNLATVATRGGDHARARALAEEASRLCRQVGDLRTAGISLLILGQLLESQGDAEGARSSVDEALSIHRKSGSLDLVGRSLCMLAVFDRAGGDAASAAGRLDEALPLFEDLRDLVGLAECLEIRGGVEADLGRPAEAARSFGAASAIREETGVDLPDRSSLEADIGRVRAELPPDVFEREWQAGASRRPY